MKRKLLQTIILTALIGLASAQDFGRIIINNSKQNNPDFIVSLNGVRLGNKYSSEVIFNYLDEKHYKVKILQQGSSKVITAMITCETNYDSKYVIIRDFQGNYKLIFESKALMKDGRGSPRRSRDAKPEEFVQEPRTKIQIQMPMPDTEYNKVLDAIKKENFESTKLEMAKTFFGNELLTSVQVLGILKTFAFENTKLDFAKLAYSKTYDKNNYFKVYEAFIMSSSKDEISKYIKENP